MSETKRSPNQTTVLDELIATTAQPVLTFTETSIPNASFGSPQYVPERGIAWLGVRATPTRIRFRLPTILARRLGETSLRELRLGGYDFHLDKDFWPDELRNDQQH